MTDLDRFLETHSSLDQKRKDILFQLWEIGELSRIFSHPAFSPDTLIRLVDSLLPVSTFYQEMGGITGYTRKLRELLEKPSSEQHKARIYHSPRFIDISRFEDPATQETISWGCEAVAEMAEIFPLGGAADRLHLIDPVTQEELPAAKLQFLQKTLLQRLMEDVQAREQLYFARFGKRVITPIAIMTSEEKNNHSHIEKMLESSAFFGRPKNSFFLFTQPLVPVVNEKGEWLFSSDLRFVGKPGGHGALWKLAKDCGVLSWMRGMQRTKALVRQINNPIAGLDYGLLSFIGIGWKKDLKFGFASCPRRVHAAEGVNVLVENERQEIALTNIEYCDFAKFGIEDAPLREGDVHSRFSSNTNLLFVDLAAVEAAVEKNPFPGLLLNMKKTGNDTLFGRLESTMQNLADVFTEKKNLSLETKETFITYNHRHKTIATTKRAFVPGGSLQETPEACFYDFLAAARELLEQKCAVELPMQRTLAEYLEKGPEFAFLYHPALGPLYQAIQQKITHGKMHLGAELICEISDLVLQNFHLEGSLRVHAKNILETPGRCVMKNIEIANRGVCWGKSLPYWKGEWLAEESVEILLEGDSEWIGENLVLKGAYRFVVPDGISMTVFQDQDSGQIKILQKQKKKM